MTILITGGTGQTGSQLARLLDIAKIPFVIASRSATVPAPFEAVKFDWFDESTYRNAFDLRSDIDKVYLVLPPLVDPTAIAKSFIDFAISKGVKRFVLLSATVMEKGGAETGKVHELLAESGAEYVVLRPTWFLTTSNFPENFGTTFASVIQDFDSIPTVTRDGRVPFVGVEDIAKAAYDALVSTEKGLKTDRYVLGPQLYSYDEAAALLSKVLGRTITHQRISPEESIASFEELGAEPEYASMLTSFALQIASGAEEAIFRDKKAIIGQVKLEDYFDANKGLWAKN
ncbi:hypothetical protein M413DRAFT_27068 [Hebeloma cylindrosporum]|uniref:NmrA-like domain-containing protein n=1 Tax=Hebeloma cylindrosporum TaxID=76867 RepID=A0A0C3CDH0_HEBCY|nr:hypothetical protein M413DRAFT_27068 [Hebeloma cylindrosporum h7]